MTDMLMLVLIPFVITGFFGILTRLVVGPTEEGSNEDREWWHAIK